MAQKTIPEIVGAIDFASPTWYAIRDYALIQIEQNQRMLELLDLGYPETQGHRYALKEWRALLKLAEPSKMPPSATDT